MLDRCVFCGEELIGGICPNKEQHIKPMCLNCEYCKREGELHPPKGGCFLLHR